MFMLNALLFVLIGLQLPVILDELSGQPTGTLLVYGLIVSATVILVRIAGTYLVAYVPRFVSKRIRERDPYPPWQHPAFISWGACGAPCPCGGPRAALDNRCGRAVSLAGPHSVPRFLRHPRDPRRARSHHAAGDPPPRARERPPRGGRGGEGTVRSAEAALARLEELVEEDWVPSDTAERLRGLCAFRHGRFTARHDREDESAHEDLQRAYQRLRRELLGAEREALEELRRDGVITERVLQRVIRDLDLEDLRLDP